MFVGEKVFERGEQKRAKPTLRTINVREPVFAQQVHEESLRGVFCIMRREPAPSCKSIERIPIRPAQRRKRLLRPTRIARRRQHHTPARRGKVASRGGIAHRPVCLLYTSPSPRD